MRAVERAKGFILMEILIVTVIIAIFAAVAYPSYLRFIKDGQAEQAKAVMNAMATAERIHQSNTEIYTTRGTGTYVSIATNSGIYTIGAMGVDTGDAPLFEFKVDFTIMGVNVGNKGGFRIVARGRTDEGMENSDTVIYSYRPTTNPRDSWTGTMLACTNC